MLELLSCLLREIKVGPEGLVSAGSAIGSTELQKNKCWTRKIWHQTWVLHSLRPVLFKTVSRVCTKRVARRGGCKHPFGVIFKLTMRRHSLVMLHDLEKSVYLAYIIFCIMWKMRHAIYKLRLLQRTSLLSLVSNIKNITIQCITIVSVKKKKKLAINLWMLYYV